MNHNQKKNARRCRPSSAESLKRNRQGAIKIYKYRTSRRILGDNTNGITIEQYKIAARILANQDSDEIDAAVYTLNRLAAKYNSGN